MNSVSRVFATKPAEIIIFEFLDCDPVLLRVSRAMKAACERAQNLRAGAVIQLRERVSEEATSARAAQICRGRPLDAMLGEHLITVTHKPTEEFANPLFRIVQMYETYVAQNPREQGFGERLLICLYRADAEIDLFLNLMMPNAVGPLVSNVDAQQRAQRDAARLHLENFIARENLARRARQILPPQEPQQQVAPSLRQLYFAQNHLNLDATRLYDLEEAAQRLAGDVEARARNAREGIVPHRLSRANLLERERIGVEAAYEENRMVQRVWATARIQINTGPVVGAPLQDILAYLRNPANRVAIGAVERLYLQWCSVIPGAIRYFWNLKFLSCSTPRENFLVALPEELAELNLLEELQLGRQNFSDFPPVLQRMPALRTLSLRENGSPIRILPPWLDARINGGFWNRLERFTKNEISCQVVRMDERLGSPVFGPQMSGLMRAGLRMRDEAYAQLPHENFTHVPFNLWFRENIAIPNFPFYAYIGALEGVERILEHANFHHEGWLEMIKTYTSPFLPFGLLICVGMLIDYGPYPLALLASYVLLISAFSFVFNFFLHFLLLPLIEAVREELGYDPLV
ncbi:MAG: hypothetical protein ACHQT8_06635, partial [Chlamydiales bacterium]